MPDSSCERCEEKKYSMDSIPCISVPMLNSLTLFRTGVAGVASEPCQRIGADSQILTLDDMKCKAPLLRIGITQIGPLFPIEVQQFTLPDGKTELTAVEEHLFSHNYCIADLNKTQQFLFFFLESKMLEYISYRADSSDPLTMRMFRAVGERAQSEAVSGYMFI